MCDVCLDRRGRLRRHIRTLFLRVLRMSMEFACRPPQNANTRLPSPLCFSIGLLRRLPDANFWRLFAGPVGFRGDGSRNREGVCRQAEGEHRQGSGASYRTAAVRIRLHAGRLIGMCIVNRARVLTRNTDTQLRIRQVASRQVEKIVWKNRNSVERDAEKSSLASTPILSRANTWYPRYTLSDSKRCLG